jgi:hypothetical protein
MIPLLPLLLYVPETKVTRYHKYARVGVKVERSHISFVFVYRKRISKKKRLTRSKLPPRVKKPDANCK